MKSRLILASCMLLFCVQVVFSQTESALKVINDFREKSQTLSNKELHVYMNKNAGSFDFNNVMDRLFYNWIVGSLWYYDDQYKEALPFLSTITEIFDQHQDEDWVLVPENYMLKAYYMESICYFRTGHSKEEIKAKLLRAKDVLERSDASETELYQGVLSELNSIDEGVLEYIQTVALALQHKMAGDYTNAIRLYECAYENVPPSYNFSAIAELLSTLCACYVEVGELRKAEELYSYAIEKLEEKHEVDIPVYRKLCDGLGVCYMQMYNKVEAKRYCNQAKLLYEKNGDFGDDYVRCLSNCAVTENMLGNEILSKIYVDVALKQIKENFGDTSLLLSTMNVMKAYTKSNLSEDEISRQAEIVSKIRPLTMFLTNASQIYEQAGFRTEAIMTIQEAIELSESYSIKNAFVYNNLALLYFKDGKYIEALNNFAKAKQLITTAYEDLDIRFNEALTMYFDDSHNSSTFANETAERLKNDVKEKFQFLSSEQRTNYWKHFLVYLPFINLMLYEEGNGDYNGEIYNNILTEKGLLLRSANAVKDAVFSSNNAELIANYEKLMELGQKSISETDQAKKEQIRKEIEQLEKSIAGKVPRLEELININLEWEQIQSSLDKDEVAIEFYNIPIIRKSVPISDSDGEPRYCAVLVKNGMKTPKIIPLCTEEELIALTETGLYQSDSLYQYLWKPLAAELTEVQTIYFAPDRELHKMAIEYALIDGEQRMSDKYNMVRLSSTRELVERKGAENPQSAVLYGGLKYDLEKDELIAESRKAGTKQLMASRAVDNEALRYGVSYLQGTQEEVENIERDLKTKGIECVTVSGNAGTEESFRALSGKSVDILHLATHGYFWSEEDAERRDYIPFLNGIGNTGMRAEDKAMLRSGLFFSGANVSLRGEELPDDVEDGVLTAMELSNLNLGNVDLVVLSACQSGLGETSGDGVFGLQRGFKLAGAKTLLMSLWKVDDKATQILMTEFYKNLLAGDTKVESLKKAQKVLQADETYKDPEYWAGWILLDALN